MTHTISGKQKFINAIKALNAAVEADRQAVTQTSSETTVSQWLQATGRSLIRRVTHMPQTVASLPGRSYSTAREKWFGADPDYPYTVQQALALVLQHAEYRQGDHDDLSFEAEISDDTLRCLQALAGDVTRLVAAKDSVDSSAETTLLKKRLNSIPPNSLLVLQAKGLWLGNKLRDATLPAPDDLLAAITPAHLQAVDGFLSKRDYVLSWSGYVAVAAFCLAMAGETNGSINQLLIDEADKDDRFSEHPEAQALSEFYNFISVAANFTLAPYVAQVLQKYVQNPKSHGANAFALLAALVNSNPVVNNLWRDDYLTPELHLLHKHAPGLQNAFAVTGWLGHLVVLHLIYYGPFNNLINEPPKLSHFTHPVSSIPGFADAMRANGREGDLAKLDAKSFKLFWLNLAPILFSQGVRTAFNRDHVEEAVKLMVNFVNYCLEQPQIGEDEAVMSPWVAWAISGLTSITLTVFIAEKARKLALYHTLRPYAATLPANPADVPVAESIGWTLQQVENLWEQSMFLFESFGMTLLILPGAWKRGLGDWIYSDDPIKQAAGGFTLVFTLLGGGLYVYSTLAGSKVEAKVEQVVTHLSGATDAQVDVENTLAPQHGQRRQILFAQPPATQQGSDEIELAQLATSTAQPPAMTFQPSK